MSNVIVIGGGAAGMMAAYAAAAGGHHVTLLEKNEKLGKKLYITGKGRCNVTNAGETPDFFAQVVHSPKSLYSAVYSFDASQVMAFMEDHGCRLKTERGNRVFPVSDHASDIIRACSCALDRAHVTVRLHTKVTGLLVQGGEEPGGAEYARVQTGVEYAGGHTDTGCASAHTHAEQSRQPRRIVGVRLEDGGQLAADAVVVATGGLSYPTTGSDGDGFLWAKELGIKVERCRPALVPLVVKEEWCRRLQGLALKNVKAALAVDGKEVCSGQGEMLFTHFGVSGPLILTMSSYYADAVRQEKEHAKAILTIDLKPALSAEQLDRRLIRDFEEIKKKQFKNALDGLFPSRLIPVMVELSGIDESKQVHNLKKEERFRFGQLIKNLSLNVVGTRGYAEAVITQGGVSMREISSSTMESRKIQGLYFAGEVLDVDALTGGYNLQIAWSTGHLAGASIPDKK